MRMETCRVNFKVKPRHNTISEEIIRKAILGNTSGQINNLRICPGEPGVLSVYFESADQHVIRNLDRDLSQRFVIEGWIERTGPIIRL